MTEILIIGFGKHARRIYYPVLSELEKDRVRIAGVVDLRTSEESIRAFEKKNKSFEKVLLVDDTKSVDVRLDRLLEANPNINAVAICSDPESHVMYATWALNNGLHVIMDKPIHAAVNAAHDKWAAREIHVKYLELLEVYKKAKEQWPSLVCDVLSQRRFHPAYNLVKKEVDYVYGSTGCPVTYFYCFHSDGQWRMPDEIESVDYHGFKNGYGKASHSGYHFYDIFSWMIESQRKDQEDSSLIVDSWANYPSNYMKQLSPEILSKVFKDEFEDLDTGRLSKYGEIDVFSRLLLKSKSGISTVAEIDLTHSGLSSRSWVDPGSRDLYKENGRLRQEQIYLNMGPFMSASITSWQGYRFGEQKVSDEDIFEPGHEFHMDISIFRNSEIIGGEPVSTYSLKDIYKPSLPDYSRGHQEDARRDGIRSFINQINLPKRVSSKHLSDSDLETHNFSSQVMSSVYESLAIGGSVELPVTKGE